MYIKINKKLEPGTIEGIKGPLNFPGRKDKCKHQRKYRLYEGSLVEAAFLHNAYRIQYAELHGDETPMSLEDFEIVSGSECGQIYFDHDWGFFSAVLASYNNHWTLRISPDDLWSVIVRNVSQALDSNWEKEKVRDLFVEERYREKEATGLRVRELLTIDNSWLFERFPGEIRSRVKMPGYVEDLEARFSTTTFDQLIANQVMIMSPFQRFFDFKVSTFCGIPGVDMRGTIEDWTTLLFKTKRLREQLTPIMNEIGLKNWFKKTIKTLKKLLQTMKHGPDKYFWKNILHWHTAVGPEDQSYWTGWMIDLLLTHEGGERPQDFQGGTNSVLLTLKDVKAGIEDVGMLVAGTFGFTVQPGKKYPIVEARQGWLLFLPKESPLSAKMQTKF